MRKIFILTAAVIASALPCFARLNPAAVFSDGAVLQQGLRLPVWGIGDPGKTVSVEFASQKVEAQVDADGKWKVYLEPLRVSSEGAPMTIRSDSESVILQDILVGEVWLCSGQSNMAYSLGVLTKAAKTPKLQPYGDYNKNVAEEFTDPLLRFNRVGPVSSPKEQVLSFGAPRNLSGWKSAGARVNSGVSATAFYFGKELREALGSVPVGLIVAAWAGRPIEPFIPQAYWESDPQLSPYYARAQAYFEEHNAYLADRAAIEEAMAAFREESKRAAADGLPRPAPPRLPQSRENQLPGAIFNGMIAQLVPYGLRGVIWYQGESNATDMPELYAVHFRGLIQSWRKVWGQGDFPFYYCQLAGYAGREKRDDTPVGDNAWSTISEAQRQALDLPGTGMAVMKDIGDADDIHPVNKLDVGKRLAIGALKNTYGKPVPVCSGPLYGEARREGARVLIRFDQAGSGLSAGIKPVMQPVQLNDGAIDGFQICGPDGKWTWATVEVTAPDTLAVWSAAVSDPVEVRYGWKGYSDRFNFYNKEGFPAAVFATGRLLNQKEQK